MNLIRTSTRLCTMMSVIPSTMFAVIPINNKITIKNKTIFFVLIKYNKEDYESLVFGI